VEEGGETAFPNSVWLDPEYGQMVRTSEHHSDCTEGGVAIRPRKGDALLFFGLKVDGEPLVVRLSSQIHWVCMSLRFATCMIGAVYEMCMEGHLNMLSMLPSFPFCSEAPGPVLLPRWLPSDQG